MRSVRFATGVAIGTALGVAGVTWSLWMLFRPKTFDLGIYAFASGTIGDLILLPVTIGGLFYLSLGSTAKAKPQVAVGLFGILTGSLVQYSWFISPSYPRQWGIPTVGHLSVGGAYHAVIFIAMAGAVSVLIYRSITFGVAPKPVKSILAATITSGTAFSLLVQFDGRYWQGDSVATNLTQASSGIVTILVAFVLALQRSQSLTEAIGVLSASILTGAACAILISSFWLQLDGSRYALLFLLSALGLGVGLDKWNYSRTVYFETPNWYDVTAWASIPVVAFGLISFVLKNLQGYGFATVGSMLVCGVGSLVIFALYVQWQMSVTNVAKHSSVWFEILALLISALAASSIYRSSLGRSIIGPSTQDDSAIAFLIDSLICTIMFSAVGTSIAAAADRYSEWENQHSATLRSTSRTPLRKDLKPFAFAFQWQLAAKLICAVSCLAIAGTVLSSYVTASNSENREIYPLAVGGLVVSLTGLATFIVVRRRLRRYPLAITCAALFCSIGLLVVAGSLLHEIRWSMTAPILVIVAVQGVLMAFDAFECVAADGCWLQGHLMERSDLMIALGFAISVGAVLPFEYLVVSNAPSAGWIVGALLYMVAIRLGTAFIVGNYYEAKSPDAFIDMGIQRAFIFNESIRIVLVSAAAGAPAVLTRFLKTADPSFASVALSAIFLVPLLTTARSFQRNNTTHLVAQSHRFNDPTPLGEMKGLEIIWIFSAEWKRAAHYLTREAKTREEFFVAGLAVHIGLQNSIRILFCIVQPLIFLLSAPFFVKVRNPVQASDEG